MGLKQIFNQASQFQNNAGAQGMNLSAMPIGLQVSYPVPLADDFNGSTKDPRWLTAPIPPPPGPAFSAAYSGTNSITKTPIVYANDRYAQTFKFTVPIKLNSASWRIHQIQGFPPPGTLVVEVWGTTGSDVHPDPTNVLAVSNPIVASSIPTVSQSNLENPPTYQLTAFTFPTPPTLNANTAYAIVIRQNNPATQPSNSVVECYRDIGSPSKANGGNSFLSLNTSGTTWIDGSSGAPPYSNFNYQIDGQQINTSPPSPNPYPIVSGGFLEFDYTTLNNIFPTVPPSIETIYNSAMGSLGLQTRMIWTILNSSAQGSDNLWGLQLLQGTIPGSTSSLPLSDAADSAELLVAVYIRASPSGNFLSFLPVIMDANGNVQCWIPQGGTTGAWLTGRDPGSQGGWFMSPAGFPTSQSPAGNAAGVPVTIQITQQPNGGVVILAYTQDNPNQIIFQTAPSPPVRVLPGSVFLDIGHSPNMFGSKFQFDYFNLGAAPVTPPSGYVIFRTPYAISSKITGFTLNRLLPGSSKINVRVRSASTLAALQAAAFSDPMPTTVAGNIETGVVAMAADLFADVMLEFIAGSTPTLNSFDFTSVPQAVDQDQPIILSLSGTAQGMVSAFSSEEGIQQTPNTAKLIDGDPNTLWVSQNATDGTTVSLQINFLQTNGALGSANVNAVVIRNTNVKALKVYIGTTVLFQGEISDPDVLIAFPLYLTPVIQIDVTTTQTPNQQKQIGDVYCGQILVVLPNFDSYEPQRLLIESGTLRTLGGKMVAFRGRDKYGSKWKTLLVRQADRDTVEAAFKQNPLITFYPEPGSSPRNLFNVGWTLASLPLSYTDRLKLAGYTIEADMEEI